MGRRRLETHELAHRSESRLLAASTDSGGKRMISVVIPVYNEQDNIVPLYEKLRPVLGGLAVESEVIFVNDGSSDSTEAVLAHVAASDPSVKVINFSRNNGQTA